MSNPTVDVVTLAGPDVRRVDQLRERATARDDLAWVLARPPATRDSYAALTQDLLAAMGVVGLGTPRAKGDRHPVRVMAHLMTSPVRQIVIAEAQWLPEEVLADFGEALLVTGVHLTLLACEPVPGWLAWVNDHVGDTTSLQIVEQRLTAAAPACLLPVDRLPDLVAWAHASSDCVVHTRRADCVVSAARRAVSSGRLAAEQAREPLTTLAIAPDSTSADWWALRAAGLDLYTPGLDAVWRSGFRGDLARLTIDQVANDGSLVAGHPVSAEAQTCVARQRSAGVWSNGLPTWPFATIFDAVPGTPGK